MFATAAVTLIVIIDNSGLLRILAKRSLAATAVERALQKAVRVSVPTKVRVLLSESRFSVMVLLSRIMRKRT